MPYLLFLGCCLVWSVSFLLMKKAVVGFSPLSVGAWRVAGGAAMLGWLCWRRGVYQRPTREQLGWISLVSLLGCGWPYAVQPLVVARQGSAFVALTVTLVPLFTITLSAIFLKVFPSRRQLIGVCGAFCFLALLLADGIRREIPVGDLALAGTVPACYAGSNILIRRKLSGLPSLWLTFLALSGTMAVLMPISWTVAAPVCESSRDWWLAAGALAVLGVLGTGLATYWFNTMIQTQGPLFAGMSTNLVPVGALVLGWYDSERVTLLQICGLVGILAMVILVQYGAAKPVQATAQADS
ncbi:MAG: DMT family transporter [Planctomycetota bacterium]|nr:DMT family transporter [Planctomycetota bacterium]